jgi:hypothetical protein
MINRSAIVERGGFAVSPPFEQEYISTGKNIAYNLKIILDFCFWK